MLAFFYRTNDVDEDGYLTTSKEQEEEVVFVQNSFTMMALPLQNSS